MSPDNRNTPTHPERIAEVREKEPNPRVVEQALWRALASAQTKYREALSEFHQVTSEVPHGLPLADGILRLEKAASPRRNAFDNYMKAMKRFSDFKLGRND